MVTPYYQRANVTVYCGDNREVLPALDVAVSAVVTDPPYGLSFMGRDWDHAVPGEAFWRIISDTMLPGAHLLSFGGTRTFHRIAVAIEDAGFELRDTLMWLYGSGFPKSHDVSKAIDKARVEDRAPRVAVTSWLAAECDRLGWSRRRLADAWGVKNQPIQDWTESNPNRATIPTWENWLRLKDIVGFGDDMDAEVWRLNGRKGAPGDNWGKREITGSAGPMWEAWERNNGVASNARSGERRDIPATPEAAQWAGWGTALKPAYEPIILARKPLREDDRNVLEMVNLQLRKQGVTGDIHWKPRPAKTAAKRNQSPSSTQTKQQSSPEETSAERVSASVTLDTANETANVSVPSNGQHEPQTRNDSGHTVEGLTEGCAPKSSPRMADDASVAARLSPTSSPSTTSTAAEHHIGSPSTARCTSSCDGSDSPTATVFCVGIATGPHGSTETVHITRDSDGAFIWPDGLPKFIKGQNLTVAANVLAHGTGALNIDASRIGTTPEDVAQREARNGVTDRNTTGYMEGWTRRDVPRTSIARGRWPANVLLDEAAAAALDAQSGVTVSGGARKHNGGRDRQSGFAMTGGTQGERDTGGGVALLSGGETGRKPAYVRRFRGTI